MTPLLSPGLLRIGLFNLVSMWPHAGQEAIVACCRH